MTILGISTNTRLVGTAIIKSGALEDYKVKLYTAPWTPLKASEIITGLEPCVRKYSIKKVILSMPPTPYQTKEFKQLTAHIKAFFELKNVEVITESVQLLQAFCSEHGRKTKKKIMQGLVKRFPELQVPYERELRNRNKYYVKVFEAVGMALLHS